MSVTSALEQEYNRSKVQKKISPGQLGEASGADESHLD